MKLTRCDDSLLESSGLSAVDIRRDQTLREGVVLSLGELENSQAFRVGLCTDDIAHLDRLRDGGLGNLVWLGSLNFPDLVCLAFIVEHAIGRH